ncbi:MAG: dynamin [Actinophytocola sp.]|uniref:dynamin family protein n=1 Tax=Actinophytocola sp. TaxID=1872138 RepID=UPI00132BA929|nr:dynamin family protein [Actinophytocola sp.]MPZ86290.1 dynamin [Actinophytocola sp.]
MTKSATVPAGPAARAADVVDLGLRACEAFDRPDLAARLTEAKRRLADPVIHVVVAGEFKQGKSSLVNALIGAPVCPVDDDAATAVPTFVRHGEQAAAQLWVGETREAIELADVRKHVVESAGNGENGMRRVTGVEVKIPRALLASGLVLVDTPGIGGLGSAHSAASLAAISLADAVLFVTSAAQELTRSEMDFLLRARSLCSTVACVLTKTDFYPAWRRIRELDEAHLAAAGVEVPLLTVSSSLRARAVKSSDAELNTESGFPALIELVRDQVGGSAERRLATEAAAEVVSLCDQVETGFAAERTALADPEAARRVVDELTAVKKHIESLKTAAAKWNQTLSDGTGDLTSDIDFDLRSRIKEVTKEADAAIEDGDPADTWSEIGTWLQSRTAAELLTNYELLRERATYLSERVGEHFREATGGMYSRPTVHDPTPLAGAGEIEHDIDLKKMRAVKQAMVALKSAYGGAVMFTLIGSMVGIMLGPIGIGIGLVMGHRGLREEKKRQVQKRRAEAKNAVRRYCDKVTFAATKDSRDTLRRVQRELRDHYTGLAEELNKSNAKALTAATEAASRTQGERDKRLKDVDAELARLRQLRERAQAVAS